MTSPSPELPPIPILRLQDAIVARLRAGFGPRLKSIDALAGELDDKTFEKIKANAPSIFVCLAAARPTTSNDDLVWDLQWGVYCVARRLQTPAKTLEGTKLEIGAIAMLTLAHAMLVQAPLDYAPEPPAGEARADQTVKPGFLDMDNLFEETMSALGVFVYGARYETKRVRIVDPGAETGVAATLDAFETFAGAFVVPPVPSGTPVPVPDPAPAGVNVAARDHVELPQE